ncbi:MAG TPA: ATP-binding cassette domain-containing protein, partial [Vicinamibacterales bacterium]|nr:ATP-binding cassette domain-containing protein [Vicinamibacterales bacterium]
MTAYPETLKGPAKGRPGDEPMVVFEDVRLAFDDHVVLDGISFTLYPGYTKIFVGASGSGKSTVLKLILGLLAPDSGKIWVHGRQIDRMTEDQLFEIRDDMGMVFQEGALFDSLTVGENVGYKLYDESDMPLDQVRARVEEVLGFVGLGPYVDRMPSALSGGQRRRVAIA